MDEKRSYIRESASRPHFRPCSSWSMSPRTEERFRKVSAVISGCTWPWSPSRRQMVFASVRASMAFWKNFTRLAAQAITQSVRMRMKVKPACGCSMMRLSFDLVAGSQSSQSFIAMRASRASR